MKDFYGFKEKKEMSAEGYNRLIKCFGPLVERIEPPLSIHSRFNEDDKLAEFEVKSLLPDDAVLEHIAANLALISIMIEASK